MFRGAVILLAMTTTLPVWAAGSASKGTESRVALASAAVQRAGRTALNGSETDALPGQRSVTARAEALASYAVAREALADTRGMEPQRKKAKSRVNYKALLAHLVVTRDLQIPGTPVMAVRLIPSRSAVVGTAVSPIVLTPRVVGSSWYGLDIAANF